MPPLVLAEMPSFQPAEQVAAAPPEQATPRRASVERRSSERPLHGNYVDNPRVTFLIDDVRIVCEICFESELVVSRPRSNIRDETPAIFPCGHVFGHKCISEWLESHSTCPTCRLKLKHTKCGHVLQASPIHIYNILRIPKTIPRGGWIGETCAQCWYRTKQVEAKRLYDAVSLFIRTTLPEHKAVFGTESHAAMVAKAEAFADSLVEECIGAQGRDWDRGSMVVYSSL